MIKNAKLVTIQCAKHTITLDPTDLKVRIEFKDPGEKPIEKTYPSPHSLRVIIGKVLADDEKAMFLNDLIIKIKCDQLRARD
jgi:hypothetical protein